MKNISKTQEKMIINDQTYRNSSKIIDDDGIETTLKHSKYMVDIKDREEFQLLVILALRRRTNDSSGGWKRFKFLIQK